MWHMSGDLNTKLYHALTKQRLTRNRILGLHDEGRHWIIEDKGVEKVAVDYFDDLFGTTPSDFDGFLEEITLTFTHQRNQRIRIVMED